MCSAIHNYVHVDPIKVNSDEFMFLLTTVACYESCLYKDAPSQRDELFVELFVLK